MSLLNVVYVALGGAVGACLRYGVSQLTLQLLGRGFPFATLIVNVLGSFIMGMMFVLLQQGQLSESPWRAFVAVGLLGALTTFSTFSMDNLLLLQQGALWKCFANVMLNVLLSLAAVAAGYYCLLKAA